MRSSARTSGETGGAEGAGLLLLLSFATALPRSSSLGCVHLNADDVFGRPEERGNIAAGQAESFEKDRLTRQVCVTKVGGVDAKVGKSASDDLKPCS
jgi:hypothetical protein